MSLLRRSLVLAILAGLAAGSVLASDEGPTRPKPSALEGSALTWCGDLEPIRADPDAYGDSPVYIWDPPADRIRRWAREKPGFADLWIDRDNLGWITVAFTEAADKRRAELARKFPDVGAAVVEVEYPTKQLRQLQRRVERVVFPVIRSGSVGIDPTTNHVGLSADPLSEELVELLETTFMGEPLCVDGPDPSELIPDGPQPLVGDGWTLLGHEQGPPDPVYRTGLASDETQLASLWAEARMPGGPPAVDFEQDVVLWFAEPHGSSCPNLRLDDVVVDHERALLHPLTVMPDDPMDCTGDLAGAYQFVVALRRDRLPPGPFDIQLRPDSAYGDRTIVDADLSAPGSVAPAGAIVADTDPAPEPLRSGAIMEVGYTERYAFDTSCGIGYLGRINGVHWVTDAREMPAAWSELVGADGELVVKVTLREEPEPRAVVRAGGKRVVYEPVREAPSDCKT